jgi:23S rRNA pseudouridine1911/1915/1917 synthase
MVACSLGSLLKRSLLYRGVSRQMPFEQMNDRQAITVHQEEAGQRLDRFLAERTGITRSQVQRHIERGDVLVNKTPVSQNYRVRVNDIITLDISREETEGLSPEPIPLEILYRDEQVVVVNKPAGMVVYPAAGNRSGTVMNALSYHCGKLAVVGGPLRPGVVHRLDKDTSGVMVVALHDDAYHNLVGQFRQRTIRRRYLALVYGDMEADTGEIRLPIGRSQTDRKKMSTRVKRGKEAVTRWKVITRFGNATLMEVSLGTGRTHQIRVHLSSVGHPVLGDKTYGKKTELVMKKGRISIQRQMLHAEMLGFAHPVTGEYMEFSSPLPEDMERVLGELS